MSAPTPPFRLRVLGRADLRDPAGRAVQPVLAQPKRFALLAYLGAARGGFHRRDTLLELFWPHLDAERARAALRKSVHHLRQALGRDSITGHGEEELGVDPAMVGSDVVAFEQAIAAGRLEDALVLYEGALLPGFAIDDAPGFERWLEERRAELRRAAADAARRRASAADAEGDLVAALRAARQALALGDTDEVALRSLMVLCERAGDRGAALRECEAYRERLRREYELELSRETLALAEAIRNRGQAPVPPAMDAPAARIEHRAFRLTPPAAWPIRLAPPAIVARARPWARRRVVVPAIFTVVIAVLAVGWWSQARAGRDAERPVLAVGAIRDFTGDDSGTVSAAIPELLANALGSEPGAAVVSPARVFELLGAGNEVTAGTMAEAARRAGATQLVEGAVYRLPGGQLRLDLRRVELVSGAVADAYTVTGGDPFALVEAALPRLAAGGSDRLLLARGATTRSLVAYRFYQEGLHAFYQLGDGRLASNHFQAALREDSAFAMAAYYTYLSNAAEFERALPFLAQARRMSRHATDRERLLIGAMWADAMNEPARLAIAETLAVRYPRDPQSHVVFGRASLWAGDFTSAIRAFRRAIGTDPADGGAHACRACEGYPGLVDTYVMVDSLEAAERVARDWLSRTPESTAAMDALANVLEFRGEIGQALALRGRIARGAASVSTYEIQRASLLGRAGRLGEGEEILRRLVADGPPGLRATAQWSLVINLRNQRRFAEALQVAHAMRREWVAADGADRGPEGAMAVGTVLQESGNYRAAAALFDSLALAVGESRGPAVAARLRTWFLTHESTALAAAGDTASLLRLVPRIEAEGRRSGYGRDQRLHWHARGLVARARGDREQAVTYFRRAIFSPTAGFTRVNLELGRTLIELRRPAEAIAVLEPALRGPIEASNLYVTRADLQALLERARATR